MSATPFSGPFVSPLSNLIHRFRTLSDRIKEETGDLSKPVSETVWSMIRERNALDVYLRKTLVFKRCS